MAAQCLAGDSAGDLFWDSQKVKCLPTFGDQKVTLNRLVQNNSRRPCKTSAV